jgi:hypothetical protein
MPQAGQQFVFWEPNGLLKDFEGMKTELYVSEQEMIAFLIAQALS